MPQSLVVVGTLKVSVHQHTLTHLSLLAILLCIGVRLLSAGTCLLSVDCKAEMLFQYAVAGPIVSACLGLANIP